MKRMLGFALAALCALATAGCPFEAQVPLGDPRPGALDARLFGVWTWFDADGGAVGQARIQPFNDAEYLVEYEEFGPAAKEPKREIYRAFPVPLGDQIFLNINQLRGEGASPRHLFARYGFSDGGGLTLRFVGDQAVPKALESNREELREFVAAHLADATLDDPDGPYVFHPARAR